MIMTGRVAMIGLPAAAAALAGCGGLTDASYRLDHGVAGYDTLKAATDRCEAKGGVIHLRKDYGGQDLSDYDCVIGKAR